MNDPWKNARRPSSRPPRATPLPPREGGTPPPPGRGNDELRLYGWNAVQAMLYSALNTATVAWSLGDIGVGLMTWLNIIALLLLQKPALAALRDYEASRGAGQDPVYRPDNVTLPASTVWLR